MRFSARRRREGAQEEGAGEVQAGSGRRLSHAGLYSVHRGPAVVLGRRPCVRVRVLSAFAEAYNGVVAHEVVREITSPCPCGKGSLVAQLSEHDTWPNRRSLSESIDCPDCRENYRIRASKLMRKGDVQEIENLAHERSELNRKRGWLTKERYRDQWRAYLGKIGTKSGVHAATREMAGAVPSVAVMYRRKTDTESYADQLIE